MFIDDVPRNYSKYGAGPSAADPLHVGVKTFLTLRFNDVQSQGPRLGSIQKCKKNKALPGHFINELSWR
ncbi:protein of unknown function [Hyphomicrobium sp. MC1]|nr:protein of unknown function [Hyphomicrobium sp. MC1]